MSLPSIIRKSPLRLAGSALVFLGLGLASCGTPKTVNYLSEHVLPVNPSGSLGKFEFRDPVPTDASARRRGGTVDEHIRLLVDAAVRDAEERGNDRVEVMVHLHGGRRTRAKSARSADDILTVMRYHSGSPNYRSALYPIFVHWRSGDFDTAGARLWDLRQGREVDLLPGVVTLPFVLFQDLARGIVRLPKSLLYQVYRDASVASEVATGWTPLRSWSNAEAIAAAMENDPNAPFEIREPNYERPAWKHALRFVCYFPTQLTKVPLQAVFLEGLGQGAWDDMRRRARNLVWVPRTFEEKKAGVDPAVVSASMDEPEGNGALPALYREIASRPERFEITVVAHSMGSIPANDSLHSLAHAIEISGGKLSVPRIIYMAPACSVSDGANALVPFLEEHVETTFHLLTLHPVAEADEVNALDLVPRGSLLEWIDNYYSNPATHHERVFGKWANAVPALGLFASVREQVQFKAFTVAAGTVPQTHGQFHAIPFWDEAAYSVDGAVNFPAGVLDQACRACLDELSDEAKDELRW